MFERFNESARRALFFARYEASELGSVSIGAGHILLGLTREPKGIVASLFALSGKTLNTLRDEVKAECKFREKVSTSIEIPFSTEVKQALTFTEDEANRLQHRYIGPEHMLLGVLRAGEGVGERILTRNGLRLDTAREEVARLSRGTGGFPTPRRQTLEQIERIKHLVAVLAALPPDSPGRFEVAQAIIVELDSLASGLPAEEPE